MTQPLDELAAAILEDGVIDAEEVAKIKERVYADGVVDKEEADFLFKLNDAVSGKENDPGWTDLFVQAISDHVLQDETSPGVIDDDEANYLIEKIKGDGVVDATELALLVNVTANATGEAPKAFNDFVLDSLKAAVIEDGVVDAAEVEMMKKVIYGAGGAAGAGVDRAEADMLFDINDATTKNEGHDASWQALFVEALSKHVLEDETSPGVIDDDEANYLIDKIKGDGVVDANELALLVNVTASATGEAPKAFNDFVLESVKAAVIEDGVVDAEEVALMKKVVYGAGGAAGAGVDRAEADMLFDINDATTDNQGHDPSWQAFFVEAIGKHVLEDETSPGAIDEDEGDWLISRIEGDDTYDANEKALLAHIKANATSIAGKLKFKIEMFG
jgi:uncharacterized membrane protein YebE (DUF533 family)